MRIKSEVNLSPVKTPAGGTGYTREEAVMEAMRCLDCPGEYCRNSCPMATPVPEMCRLIRAEDFEKAYSIVAENNVLTSMSCRVCPAERQCEAHCTRGIRGEAVNIAGLEQFLNDLHGTPEKKEKFAPPSGRSVAVVGSGPAGITCAMELLKAGCPVTIYDAAEKPGGVPRWGIPGFVLPPEVTEKILCRAESMGAEFICGKRLGEDITLEELLKNHSAVFLGTGAPIPLSGGFENAMQAKDLLREASLGRDPVRGRAVTVIGGGDTAIDAVRVAVKLGAEKVTLVYRRGRAEMPACKEDVDAAEREGVNFVWWTEPVSVEGEKLLCRKTEPSAPDYPGGRLNAVSVAGTEFAIGSGITVLALGFRNAPVGGVSCDGQGRMLTDENGRTNLPGVFAGGDAVTGPSTVTRAAAAGKKAAAAILSYVKA